MYNYKHYTYFLVNYSLVNYVILNIVCQDKFFDDIRHIKMNKSNLKFDLHIHSTASDGTDSPEVLLENIKNAGIGIFALTDHDTITGVLEMQKIVPDDIVFIKGIEFSCKTEAGKCHILGYNYDENAPEFKKIIEEGIGKRRRKLESDVLCL